MKTSRPCPPGRKLFVSFLLTLVPAFIAVSVPLAMLLIWTGHLGAAYVNYIGGPPSIHGRIFGYWYLDVFGTRIDIHDWQFQALFWVYTFVLWFLWYLAISKVPLFKKAALGTLYVRMPWSKQTKDQPTPEPRSAGDGETHA